MTDLDQMTDRDGRLLGGIRMIATLGHSCGLVDPYTYTVDEHPAPILAILERLAEVSPWLVETWEFKRAIARAKGERSL